MDSGILIPIFIFFPFAAGLIAYAIGYYKENYRDMFVISSGVLVFLGLLWYAYMQVTAGVDQPFVSIFLPGICGMGLHFEMDGFRAIYTVIAGLMWMMTLILSKEYMKGHHHKNRFYFYMLWTLGATLGVFFSANLFTTFVFFEIMSFTSYAWVAQEENEASLKAAGTYLAVAVIGGLVMLMGLFLLYHELGTLEMGELRKALLETGNQNRPVIYAAGICMLFGFGAKAGAFPLHIWLPKAHPVAPAPASALLSGILTKTGIFGILVITTELFFGNSTWGALLLVLGELTMFGGALLAVFSVDLKRTLACSSMSQIGFILVGIGMQCLLGEENALAVHGTMLHMINHSMIKLVLFMAAGVVYWNTHSLDLNTIRGYGRKKPLLKVVFLVGALSIAGIPMFSGYISKTLLHESIVEYGGFAIKCAEWIFLLSGGMTLAYMTKLYVAIFVEENAEKKRQETYDKKKPYMNQGSTFALCGSALLLFLWGIVPHMTMDKAAGLGQSFMGLTEEGHQVAYYSLKNLSGAAISILIGVFLYFFIIRVFLRKKEKEHYVYINAWPRWLDLENILYRPLLLKIFPVVFGILFRIFDTILDGIIVFLRKTLLKDSPLPYERDEGTYFTEILGHFRNWVQKIGNQTWNRKHPTNVDYVHVEAIKREEFSENFHMIQRSLSFGLMLFGVGLMLTLIYLVFM